MHEREIAEEQTFLEFAYEAHAQMLADAELSRKRYAVSDGVPGDLSVRDGAMDNFLRRIDHLQIGNTPLFFGRLDFSATSPKGEATYRLGRISIVDLDQNQLIIDWRAPIAEAFYRATAIENFGVTRRRHISIRNRQVLSVEDEFLSDEGAEMADASATAPAINEEGLVEGGLALGGPAALLAALGRARTGRMGDIVDTIQREQDEIIRTDLNTILLVQGGPGTGKTAVALHRAAYLLYTYRATLERQRGVLVVGPNPVFMGYIGNVLPSLGESGVTLTTVTDLVRGVAVRGKESDELAQLKGDIRMQEVIARALATRQRALRKIMDVPFGRFVLKVTPEETKAIVDRAKRRGGQHNPRRSVVGRELARALADQYRTRSGVTAEYLEIEDVEGGLEEAIRVTAAFKQILQRLWPRLTGQDLLHDLFGAEPLLRVAGRDILTDEEIRLLVRPRSEYMGDIPWTDADLALIDEARVLLGPRKKPRGHSRVVDSELTLEDVDQLPDHHRDAALRERTVVTRVVERDFDEAEFVKHGHIVVDEAQDLSAMQLRVIGRRNETGSMTIVGDMAQATTAAASASWDATMEILASTKKPSRVDLSVSYRTPEEVLEFAAPTLRAAMPDLKPPVPVRRAGSAPRVVRADVPTLGLTLARVAREELDGVHGGRIAIIVTTTRVGEIVALLAAHGVVAIDPANDLETGLAADIVVIPSEGANGLEFDGVVVVEPAEIASRGGAAGSITPRGLRTLYVSLTRPTRRLAVVHVGELPPSLS
ncbi:MAG: AAA family ATPase [Actinobacteria bacterium]|nr:AAA family ATPase [Actinomycetota bacterium]